jgi:CBS domain-containing protein
MKAKDLMVSPVVSVPLGTNLEEAARLMWKGVSGAFWWWMGRGGLWASSPRATS